MPVDDGKDVPTLSDIGFGFPLANGVDDLTGHFFNRHHPKQSFAFGHCCIDKAGAYVGNCYVTAALESFLTQGFHVADLIGFRCAVGWCHWLTAQSACRGDGDEVAVTLLLEDVVERINDERPTPYVRLYCWAFQCIVK